MHANKALLNIKLLSIAFKLKQICRRGQSYYSTADRPHRRQLTVPTTAIRQDKRLNCWLNDWVKTVISPTSTGFMFTLMSMKSFIWLLSFCQKKSKGRRRHGSLSYTNRLKDLNLELSSLYALTLNDKNTPFTRRIYRQVADLVFSTDN